MFSLPPLPPTWDGFHPLFVHFPIGLLIVAPLLVVMGLLLCKHERGLNYGALALMAVGTAGAFLAMSTGEAADDAASVTGAVSRLIHEHEEAAELARNVAVVLTLAFAGVTALPLLAPKVKRGVRVGVTVVFLLVYGVGLLPLMHTGHLGGELVHTHGVRARLSAGAGTGAPNTGDAPSVRQEEEGEHE